MLARDLAERLLKTPDLPVVMFAYNYDMPVYANVGGVEVIEENGVGKVLHIDSGEWL